MYLYLYLDLKTTSSKLPADQEGEPDINAHRGVARNPDANPTPISGIGFVSRCPGDVPNG